MASVAQFEKVVRGSALGACPRRLAHQAGFIDITSPRPVWDGLPSTNHRFDDGHWHEFDMKRRMGVVGVRFQAGISRVLTVKIALADDWWIEGHIDGLCTVPPDTGLKWLPEGRYTHEAKSMAPGSYWKFVRARYRNGFPSYFDQIQGYLFSTPLFWSAMSKEENPVAPLYETLIEFDDYEPAIESLVLPQRALITAKNKETGGIYSEVVERDEAHWEGLQRRWRNAREAVRREEEPDIFYENGNNFECRECPLNERCWGEGTAVVALPVTSPDVNNAVKLLTVGKALSRIADQMVSAAETELTPTTLGKFEVGDVKINRYKVKREAWDHTRLKRELPPEYLSEVCVTTESEQVRRTVPEVTPTELRNLIAELQEQQLPVLLGESNGSGEDSSSG